MTEVDLISTNLITEIQCGTSVNRAITDQRRADFALLLAMLSNDACETTPIENVLSDRIDEEKARTLFSVPPAQQLKSDSDSYQTSAHIADMFHSSGLSAAKLNHYLTPEALCYQPENTHNLPEDIFHNLSGHTVRRMKNKDSNNQYLNKDLHHLLVDAYRRDQLSAHA